MNYSSLIAFLFCMFFCASSCYEISVILHEKSNVKNCGMKNKKNPIVIVIILVVWLQNYQTHWQRSRLCIAFLVERHSMSSKAKGVSGRGIEMHSEMKKKKRDAKRGKLTNAHGSQMPQSMWILPVCLCALCARICQLVVAFSEIIIFGRQ